MSRDSLPYSFVYIKELGEVEFLNKELLNICYKKHNKEIDLTWEELAQQYGFSSGEFAQLV